MYYEVFFLEKSWLIRFHSSNFPFKDPIFQFSLAAIENK